tara:strand:+ start:3370 stop:4380 length:1011 start_codon:yes stop_codon:yes gene_type:complete
MQNYNKILDECIDLILNQNYSIKDCLVKYPELQNDLSQDLLLATSVNEKFKRTINEETKTKSKTLLLKKFNDKEKYQSISLNKISGKFVKAIPSIISRWSSIAAAILIFSTIGTTTLVSASSDSNPDENLYPVKRAVENMRLTLTFNSEKKNELRMGYSNKRIEEITSMANKGVFEKIEILQQDLEKNIEIISNNDSETVKEKIFQELKEGFLTKEEAETFLQQENTNYEITAKENNQTDITYPRKERIMKLKHYIENKELKIKELCEKMEKFDSPEFQEKMNKIEKNNPERWNKMKNRQETLLLNCQKHIEKHMIYKEKLANLMSEKVTKNYMLP